MTLALVIWAAVALAVIVGRFREGPLRRMGWALFWPLGIAVALFVFVALYVTWPRPE